MRPVVADGLNGVDDLRGAPPAPAANLLDERGVQFLPRPGSPRHRGSRPCPGS
ncbi:hypothetical protein O1L55_35420 [Streptomyces albulus]|nr:hypothetical protein [Streptomyces noursei]